MNPYLARSGRLPQIAVCSETQIRFAQYSSLMTNYTGKIRFSTIPLVSKNMVDITLLTDLESRAFTGDGDGPCFHTELCCLLLGSKKKIKFHHLTTHRLVWSRKICILTGVCSGWSKRGNHLTHLRFNLRSGYSAGGRANKIYLPGCYSEPSPTLKGPFYFLVWRF